MNSYTYCIIQELLSIPTTWFFWGEGGGVASFGDGAVQAQTISISERERDWIHVFTGFL